MRIVVVNPPPAVHWAVQLGKTEPLPPKCATADSVEFEFTIRVAGETTSGAPRILGLAVQGPPDARFVYVNSGQYSGDAKVSSGRRAKVPLNGITYALIAKLGSNVTSILEARINGVARDGGPACASVKLLGKGWAIAHVRA